MLISTLLRGLLLAISLLMWLCYGRFVLWLFLSGRFHDPAMLRVELAFESLVISCYRTTVVSAPIGALGVAAWGLNAIFAAIAWSWFVRHRNGVLALDVKAKVNHLFPRVTHQRLAQAGHQWIAVGIVVHALSSAVVASSKQNVLGSCMGLDGIIGVHLWWNWTGHVGFGTLDESFWLALWYLVDLGLDLGLFFFADIDLVNGLIIFQKPLIGLVINIWGWWLLVVGVFVAYFLLLDRPQPSIFILL